MVANKICSSHYHLWQILKHWCMRMYMLIGNKVKCKKFAIRLSLPFIPYRLTILTVDFSSLLQLAV